VFKLLFAQYNTNDFSGADVLAHAPDWQVLDLNSSMSNATYITVVDVRLLQVDVAVKDDHFASTTGWVFATYVYDESRYPAEANAWRCLTPVGIQWDNDPTVTSGGTITQTWFNPNLPSAFKNHLGFGGRLVGPVDDQRSSCLSCHSTAEVDTAFKGSKLFTPASFTNPNKKASSPYVCSDPMDWFRNLSSGISGSTPFGRQPLVGNDLLCPVDTTIAGLTSTDYSLQIQAALASVESFGVQNPCSASAKTYHDSTGDLEATRQMMMRMAKRNSLPLQIRPSTSQRLKLGSDVKLQRLEDADPDHLR
jgi:hypothetical protein